MTPTQTMHVFIREILPIYHTFAFFDFPKTGNLVPPCFLFVSAFVSFSKDGELLAKVGALLFVP